MVTLTERVAFRRRSDVRVTSRFPSRMNGAAMRARSLFQGLVERRKERREIVHNAGKLHFRAVDQPVAVFAVPLKAVHHTGRSPTLDHQTRTAGFRTLRRMTYVRRQEKDISFF
jgi:hypothetical protein